VSDRSYPDDNVDQDLVQVVLNPSEGKLILEARVAGALRTLDTVTDVDLAPGRKHSYKLSLRGDTVEFVLDGSTRLRSADEGLPRRGYFQWEVAQGTHVHWDKVGISL
jgi:hypothetical protein